MDIKRQIQQRVRNWKPDGKCVVHSTKKCCVYDRQGQTTQLHICGLNLAQIPSEVWQCSSLRELDLENNQLSTLPAEVGQLSSLQWLYLLYNQLSTLPAEVGQLSSLQGLNLSNNQLSMLPAEVGQLSSLQALDLENNQLSTLPAEVGQLSSLQWLNLSNNQLSTLSAEVGQLSSLHTLDLSNNPLQSPSPDIVDQGIPAILSYLRKQRPIKIFYCYAHEDRDLRDRIDKHLGVLKRLGQVAGWYDREIQAGTDWKQEIEAHLSTASIILLLVSADFVNSNYCYGMEMRRALEMHEKGKACVIPILLRPVDWQGAPFTKLQMLPTGAKPITRWLDPEEALEDVARQIRVVVNTLRASKI